MTLGELITELEKHQPKKIINWGFGSPHSYRGNYVDLAFTPAKNTTVGKMLVHAKGALYETFTGWKGGDFTMMDDTEVWLAGDGNVGDEINFMVLNSMLNNASAVDDAGIKRHFMDLCSQYDSIEEEG